MQWYEDDPLYNSKEEHLRHTGREVSAWISNVSLMLMIILIYNTRSYCLVQLYEPMDTFGIQVTNECDCPFFSFPTTLHTLTHLLQRGVQMSSKRRQPSMLVHMKKLYGEMKQLKTEVSLRCVMM